MSKKFTIAGSLAVTEDISVKNLTVTGKTTTENQETLSVKDNLIITNAEGVDLQSLLSGLAIRKDSLSAYGIVYDPSDDSVKLGLGSIVEGEFKFDENEGLPVVVRGDLVDGNLVQFSSTGNKLVDSGKGISELVTFTDYASAKKAGVVKTSNESGVTMLADGRIAIVGATDEQINEKISYRNPIMPETIDYAVKVGITTNTETLSDTEKTDACKWLGAIPNAIPAGRNFGEGKLLAFNTNDVLTYTQIITGASGDEKLLQYTIPIRGETGVIYGAAPTTDWGLTPKKYVDEAIASAAGTKVLVGGEAVAEFDTDTKVGFTDYATTTKVGLVKNAGEIYGIRINPDNGDISLAPINNAEIEAKSVNKAIKASNLDYAVKVGITTNTETLTDEEKYLATTWLGAVKHADTPTGYAAVYAIDRQGNDITVSYSPQVSSWALAQRGDGGTLFVGEPTDDKHATTKSYVDNLPDKITDEAIKAKWVAWLGTPEGEDLLTKTEADEAYVKKSSDNRCVYGREKNAETPIILDYANTAGVNSIPFRGLNGSLYIPTKSIQEPGAVPAGQQAINKDYVDKLPDYLTLTDEQKAKWAEWLGVKKYYLHRLSFIWQGAGWWETSIELINSTPSALTASEFIKAIRNNKYAVSLENVDGYNFDPGTVNVTGVISVKGETVVLNGIEVNLETREIAPIIDLGIMGSSEDTVTEI